MKKMKIEYLYRPGRTLDETDLNILAREIKRVAASCLHEVPGYQCLQGTRESFSDKVITLARDELGTLRGFSSAILIDVPSVGKILHLGLTCVVPGYRSLGLTHQLSSKLLSRFVLSRRPLSRLWVTNVACVLSSLGNVASHFDNVYPKPLGLPKPTKTHLAIAHDVDRRHRDKLYISSNASFDEKSFVFKGSVKNTPFQKSPFDSRFHHRDENMNIYYRRLMNFAEGDEVLQVGYVSSATLLSYAFSKTAKKLRKTLRFALGRRVA